MPKSKYMSKLFDKHTGSMYNKHTVSMLKDIVL